MKTQKTRIGFRMQLAAEYVARHPGCTQQEAALAIGPNGSHRFGVAALRRAERAGLIRYEGDQRGYALYPV